MDYFTTHVVASEPALFVICRYLSKIRSGQTLEKLRESLAPAAIIGKESESNVIRASLAVGKDLGLVRVDGRGERAVWTVEDTVAAQFAEASSIDSGAFRAFVLRRVGATAMTEINSGERPSDLALGLAWLLQQDPMAPIVETWADGPEAMIEKAGMRTAVKGAERWRALMRWAHALGLITRISSNARKYVVVDPSKAIAAELKELPVRAPASQWLSRLVTTIPVLGDRRLIELLPRGAVGDDTVSRSIVLALHKLERSGRLRLISADDAADVVVLGLGNQRRRVGHIEVVRESA